jgi:RNA polymerase sigma-70 factor
MDKRDRLFLEITRNRAAVMAVIVAMVRDFGNADDIFQDTVQAIIKSADRYDENREFLPWARAIARNMVLQFLRKQKRDPEPMEQERLDYLADIMCEDRATDDVWGEARALLRGCFEKVSSQNQRLLILRYGENLKGARLAQQSGRSEGSLRTTLSRLRSFLKDCIKDMAQREGVAVHG